MYLRLENNYATCDRKVDSARWEESNAEDLFRNASDPDDQLKPIGIYMEGEEHDEKNY